ncbi:MAG: ATP-binding protein [Verrucomicrobiota bacterium]
MTGKFGESVSLLAPLAVGLAIIAGVSFRIAGTVASGLVAVTVFWLAYVLRWGTLPHQGAFFGAGLVLLICLFSFSAALAVSYHVRTADIATQRENMLHKVFDSLPIGAWVRALDGQTVFVNERWASFSDREAYDIMHSSSTQPPVDLGEEWAAELEDLLTSDSGAVRYRSIDLEDCDGQSCSMTLLTLRLYIDHLDEYGTLALLIDETALRMYEKRMQKSQDSLRVALDNAGMGFWDEDVVRKRATCDAAWFGLMGLEYDASADPLQVWEERLHPDDRMRVDAAYNEYYKKGEGSLRIDYRIRKADDNYIWVQDCVCVTEFTEDGAPKRLMGTMQDISSSKRTEIDLNYAKERAESANEAKGQFIAMISHEIRTPLNAIIGLSSFLSEGELDEEQLDLAQTIYTSGRSLLLLVNDILDFSKIEAGHLDLEMQEFPIRMCFEDSVKLFKMRAAEKKVTLGLHLDEELSEYAIGDMERLRQIVQNLLSNALKFTDRGDVQVFVRQVHVMDLPDHIRPDQLEPIGYLDRPDHEYIEVLVRDSGIGIPADQQHLLFQAFSQVDSSATRKYEGTGLGLVICKRLVHAMGGRIWVESNEGQGAVFGFTARTKLIHESSDLVPFESKKSELADRIAEDHPCDILIVGPKGVTDPLVLACRKLGYAPHHSEGYDLSANAYGRRHYNILFVWMEDEAGSLEMARKVCAAGGIKRPEAIVGFIPQGRNISHERCRLSGMQRILEDDPKPEVIRHTILDVLSTHG